LTQFCIRLMIVRDKLESIPEVCVGAALNLEVNYSGTCCFDLLLEHGPLI